MVEEKTVQALDVPRLAVRLSSGKEVHHPLSGSEITVGRDPSNRICIGDHFVSKFHAKLLVSNASVTVVDLGSANKTYVNGRPVDEASLSIGDEIRFAGVHCRLLGPPRSEERPAASAPPPPVPAAAPPSVARAKKPPEAGRAKAAPAKAKPAGRSTAPKLEDDPMKRLLKIGGLLILLTLVLAILLRVLLAPSAETEESASARQTEASVADTSGSSPASGESATETDSDPAPPSTGTPVDPEPPDVEADAQYYFDEALSLLDAGRLKQARAAFLKVLELEPDNTRATTRLSLLEEEIEGKAERHFNNARAAFQFLRYDEAIAEWEMFLSLAERSDPRHAEAVEGIEQARAKLR